MRSSKSRSRSKANRPRTLGNIINRVFDSSGPEGKVRGTPQQIIEKYQTLARDAQLSNDRVAAENFLQHAEHYTRLLAEAMREMAAEQESRQGQNASYHQGGNGQNGGGQNGGAHHGGANQGGGQWNQGAQPRSHDPRGDLTESDQPYPQAAVGEGGLVELPEANTQPARKFEPRPPRQNNDQRGPDRRRDQDRRPQTPQLRFEDGASSDQPSPAAQPAANDAAIEPAPKPAPIFESPAAVVAQIADTPKPRAPRPRKPAAQAAPDHQQGAATQSTAENGTSEKGTSDHQPAATDETAL